MDAPELTDIIPDGWDHEDDTGRLVGSEATVADLFPLAP